MMRVGVFTYFQDDNPGTFMQAYCTLSGLRQRFPKAHVEIVNCAYHRRHFRLRRSTVSALPGSVWRDYRRYGIYEKTKAEFLSLGKEDLRTRCTQAATEFIKRQEYDLIVVGSDLILQWLPFHFEDNMVPPSWLSPDLKCRKVMAAASAAQLEIGQLTEEQKEYMQRVVAEFELLGVRDKPTYRLIQGLGVTDNRLQVVPDPTFTYTIEYSHIERVSARKGLDLSRPTIVLHLTQKNVHARGLAERFRERGYQILSLNEAKYADVTLTDISPMEWAAILKKASLVVTGRFHDSIFSLKNCVPIYLVPSAEWLFDKEGDSKFYSLMKAFGLAETNFTPTSELKDAADFYRRAMVALESYDPQEVIATLRNMRDGYEAHINRIGE